MLSDAEREQLKPLVRTMQIIVGALAIGVVNFLAVVIWIALSSNDPAVDPPRLTYAAIGVAILAFAASALLAMFLAGRLKQELANTSPIAGGGVRDFRRYAGVYQTLLIIRCAILEGAAFFSLVSFMVEHHIGGVVLAMLLLLAILVQFPTMSRLESWIENELLTAEQMRHLGR